MKTEGFVKQFCIKASAVSKLQMCIDQGRDNQPSQYNFLQRVVIIFAFKEFGFRLLEKFG